MEIDKLKQAYGSLNEYYLLRKGEKENLSQIINDKKNKLSETEQQIYLLKQVSKIYQMAAEYARDKSKNAMENIVTRALSIIFPGDLEFTIEMEDKGDKAEAYFFVSSTYGGEQMVKNDPQESRGGGIVDIISLALRIALLETSDLPKNGPLVLDEPAKHVSQEYSRQVADFLHMVVNTFNRQIIMVTHNHYLADAGNCTYEVSIETGKSKVVSRFTSMT